MAERLPASWSPGALPITARVVSCACGVDAVRADVQLRWVPGATIKTEAIVLRSIRYGEADRILHLYTTARGRIGAIAKGARRPKSRFGGRLQPFFRSDLVLHEGRGELLTVTGAATVAAYPRLRSSGPCLDAAARACDAVLRLLDSAEPNLPAYNLLCHYLALLDGVPTRSRSPDCTRLWPFVSSSPLSPALPRSSRLARVAARSSTSRVLRRGRGVVCNELRGRLL